MCNRKVYYIFKCGECKPARIFRLSESIDTLKVHWSWCSKNWKWKCRKLGQIKCIFSFNWFRTTFGDSWVTCLSSYVMLYWWPQTEPCSEIRILTRATKDSQPFDNTDSKRKHDLIKFLIIICSHSKKPAMKSVLCLTKWFWYENHYIETSS